MGIKRILRMFIRPERSLMDFRAAVAPLVLIANKFDANQLTGRAQKLGCCGPSTIAPEEMVLLSDALGRPLLTVADCLKARAAVGGALNFDHVPVEQSQ